MHDLVCSYDSELSVPGWLAGWLALRPPRRPGKLFSPLRPREVTTASWRVAGMAPATTVYRLRAIRDRPPPVHRRTGRPSPGTCMLPSRGRRPEAELGAALTSREAEEV
jgi:hypothetical protein